MKSMSSQIERRFEISSSVVGIIDGSFEIGCEKAASSYLWIFVLMGNLLRGIGEAPIMPLGVSYVDDFAKEENSAFYIGTIRSSGMVGPTLGFLLGSFCANLWVDVGVVDLESLTINPKDVRWVGAWWLGLVICGAVSFLASLPFWFFPYSLPKEGEERNLKKLSESSVTIQEDHCKIESPNQPQLKFSEAVKDFLPTLKKLLGNPVFLVYLSLTILQYNSMVGLITFETKFMEQQFNVSVSRAIFLIGGLPAPIYFGALIDQTCLKWGTKSCGGSGSCRVYDTKAFSTGSRTYPAVGEERYMEEQWGWGDEGAKRGEDSERGSTKRVGGRAAEATHNRPLPGACLHTPAIAACSQHWPEMGWGGRGALLAKSWHTAGAVLMDWPARRTASSPHHPSPSSATGPSHSPLMGRQLANRNLDSSRTHHY
ncbi:Solute carrier organic anion transporter family member 1C1 [Chelonia mydas]|uniref:Solute carrier organic anion transporter family member 1C1 n=1 Tax=Chelonia mydas TaxID=8469 RepID=M7AQC5_CHEMY|nr:Solute carrier organic anion transporter family member 1C1 [Chelonia mydas]